MTIREFKNVFGNLNIKFKKIVPDDYVITNDDVIKGSLFQKFVYCNGITSIIDGFTILNDEICYNYAKLERIEIECDDIFPPCGGEIELIVNAIYSIHSINTSGEDTILEDNKKSKISTLINLDNDAFEYIKPNIVKDTPNYSDENVELNILATYYYKGVKYTCSKHVIQTINTVSSWLLESETTTSINLNLSKNVVDKTGGNVIANVERVFSRTYYKIDSCGNKVGGKNEPGHIEDITNKCMFTSSDKVNFPIRKNIISVKEQSIDAPQRSAVITANFFGFESTATLTQKQGGKIYYKYDLSFDDGKFNKFIDLETSLTTEINVPLISKKHKYIDDKYVSTYNTTNLSVECDSEWASASILEAADSILLVVKATEPNRDKDNDREALFTIRNKDDESLVIKLVISQSSLNVVDESFECNFYGNGVYSSDELDKANLFYKVFKVLKYENGDLEHNHYDKPLGDFKIESTSTDDRYLNVDSIKYNYDKNVYVVKLNNKTKQSIKDVDIRFKMKFDVCTSSVGHVTTKGNTIIDYDYELCFDKHNKFENLIWNKVKGEKTIKLHSLKHVLVNGIEKEIENLPFKIGAYDENGKEFFDECFSVKINGDELAIFPYKVNKSVSRTYIIKQLESGLEIKLKLDYTSNDTKFKVPLKVVLYSKSLDKDLYTGDGGYLLIDDKDKIGLNPCWLSPTMMDNYDIAFDGIIELTEGEHKFETFKVICIEGVKKTHKEIKLKEFIKVDKATKSIILKMVS